MAVAFPEFIHKKVTIPSEDGPIDIAYQIGGSGPPLLLLHGFPQTKAIWYRVAPGLAEYFTVIASDLRGYGESSKPHGKQDHSTYSKRSMAADQHSLMKVLGYDRFYLIGHDRGGRVSHRLAVDYPDSVLRLMVLDISPTLTMYEQTNMVFVHVPAEQCHALAAHLAEAGVLILPGPRLRLVTHLDIDRHGVDRAIDGFRRFFC